MLSSLWRPAKDTFRCRLNQKFSKDSLYLLHGSPTIVEILCGLKFHVSPLSFFQPNTNTAEILFNAVGELMSLGPEVTVLDICCGTGTIGLCLAKVSFK
jgi:tRNA/tmRNA/rRNA uracil-C5-methylase (TrmA/RlmC/RlmD family)